MERHTLRPIPDAADNRGHGDHGVEHLELPAPAQPKKSTLLLIALSLASLLAVMFVVGWLPRMRRDQGLRERIAETQNEKPPVVVVTPKRAAASSELSLPGTVEALQETTIYARTSGYLKNWLVDIGDKVAADQTLAIIDTPELDQQLGEARATLSQSQASLAQSKTALELARTSLARVKALAPSGMASQEDLDQREAAHRAAEAGVNAASSLVAANEANVRRLVDMKSFSRVAAPFAGRITSRTTERGALINAGSGAGQALFKVAESDPVRVFINVPQSSASLVAVGTPANLILRESPDHKFKGSVARTAQALDPATHTLLTEVHVPNPDGTLLTGTYAQVQFSVTRPQQQISVPGSAVIFSADGTQLAVVAEGDRIKMVNVRLGVDYGTEVEVLSGLAGDERVVANPGQRLADGVLVQVIVPDVHKGGPAQH